MVNTKNPFIIPTVSPCFLLDLPHGTNCRLLIALISCACLVMVSGASDNGKRPLIAGCNLFFF